MIDKSFWFGKKVFLTGHTGFKGSWLSIWLKELGAEVCGYALAPNTEPSLYELAEIDKIVDSVIGDIRDLDFLSKTMNDFDPDIVIHMAAQPLVRESYENPVDTYAINVMGTVNVLESIRHCSSVKAVVNVTTDKVYENKEWIWGHRETDSLGGYDPYSNSKACSELVTSSYVNSFFNPNNYSEHGIAIATARAGNVIGGGDWAKDRLVPDIIRAMYDDNQIILRNPSASRPWQHVIEPLAGYMMLAEKLYTKGISYATSWNFGSNRNDTKSVQQIVELLLKEFNVKKKFKIEAEENFHETQQLQLDSTKAIEQLGWKQRWDAYRTIKMIVDWNKQVYCNKSNVYNICKQQIYEYTNAK